MHIDAVAILIANATTAAVFMKFYTPRWPAVFACFLLSVCLVWHLRALSKEEKDRP